MVEILCLEEHVPSICLNLIVFVAMLDGSYWYAQPGRRMLQHC
jgi:hypothetical protein